MESSPGPRNWGRQKRVSRVTPFRHSHEGGVFLGRVVPGGNGCQSRVCVNGKDGKGVASLFAG